MAAIRDPTTTPESTSNGEVPNSSSRTSPATAPPIIGNDHDERHEAHDLYEPHGRQLCHVRFDSQRSDAASIAGRPDPGERGSGLPHATPIVVCPVRE